MGDRGNPNYLDFSATQVLAVPEGFVWKMRARGGLMRLSGSDSHRWTRFWLMGLLPVARMGGDRTILAPRMGAMWLKPYSGRRRQCCPAPVLAGKTWMMTAPGSLCSMETCRSPLT